MAKLGLGEGIATGLVGLLQGYAQGRAQRRANELEQQKFGLEKQKTDALLKHYGSGAAKNKAELAEKGFTETGDIDPDFYTPPNAVTPEAMGSLDMGGAAGSAAAAEAGVPDFSSVAVEAAKSQTNPMPEGKPSYLRSQRAAELRRSQLAAGNRPGDAPLTPEQQAEYERLTALAPGSAAGMTRGHLAGAAQYVAGQEAASGRMRTTIDAAAARAEAERKAKADEAERQRKFQADQKEKDRRAKADAAKKSGKGLTPGQKAIDVKVGQQYADYVAGGGAARAQAGISELEKEANKLRGRQYGIGDKIIGAIPFKSARDFLDPEIAAIQDRYESVVQEQLKPILGSQFAAKEAEQFFQRNYNPRLSPQENASRMDREIAKYKSAANDAQSAFQFFEKNGTLQGFVPDRRTLYAPAPAPGSSGEVREYSKSRNQTRVMRDGKVVQVLDGDQR